MNLSNFYKKLKKSTYAGKTDTIEYSEKIICVKCQFRFEGEIR